MLATWKCIQTGVGGKDEDDHENQEDKIRWRKSENISLTGLNEVEYNSCINDYGGKPEDEIFSLFFSDNMLTLLVDQTNLYASRDRNALHFATDITEMRKFLGLLLISGYHHLPGEDDYWSTADDMAALIFPRTMSRKRIRDIKQYFYIADNQNLAKSKMAKILLLLEN